MMQPTTKAELKHLVDNWRELYIVLNDVDTSLITDMSDLFRCMDNFNEPIGNWDTGNVTNMRGMFSGTCFVQPTFKLGYWECYQYE